MCIEREREKDVCVYVYVCIYIYIYIYIKALKQPIFSVFLSDSEAENSEITFGDIKQEHIENKQAVQITRNYDNTTNNEDKRHSTIII